MQIWLEQALIGVKNRQRGADLSDSIDFWLRKMGTDEIRCISDLALRGGSVAHLFALFSACNPPMHIRRIGSAEIVSAEIRG